MKEFSFFSQLNTTVLTLSFFNNRRFGAGWREIQEDEIRKEFDKNTYQEHYLFYINHQYSTSAQ